MEKIVLGGGCFWCLEAAYQIIPGVVKVTSGYSGGDGPEPTYREVCGGNTGYAEVVEVEFDMAVVNLNKILTVFWKIHDPTSLNKQGADEGTQYRSCIFYSTDDQKAIIDEQIKKITENQVYDKPIVTQIAPLGIFYPAEAYHQNYFKQHPEQGYCQLVIAPKLAKLKDL